MRPDTTYTASFYAKGGRRLRRPGDGLAPDRRRETPPSPRRDAADHGRRGKNTRSRSRPAHDAPTTAKARFVLSASGTGSVSFSLVSLFPPTYKDTPNGLRPDLMELLAELRPKFIRLPGGNYLEGNRFADRFNWKQMIGPADQRPGHMGRWGYRSSDGFGLPEFLLWCKQLGAEPVLGLFAGYVLNGDHFKAGSPEMALYTQEALEEIEYVSGPADSEWGKKRAADGFPEPFPAALRRDRQRGLVRPLGQLRRPVHADGLGDPRAVPAPEDHRLRAGEELQARPLRRPLLPQRRASCCEMATITTRRPPGGAR